MLIHPNQTHYPPSYDELRLLAPPKVFDPVISTAAVEEEPSPMGDTVPISSNVTHEDPCLVSLSPVFEAW